VPPRSDPSPYEQVLGDRASTLHPGLQAYFAGIPVGWLGTGTGTFQTVGTPRRWLWPVLWVLERQGILFPVWERDVPFSVVNRSSRDRDGTVAVTAVRTFRTTARTRRMVDAITAEGAELVDDLGYRRRYRARFAVSVESGALKMTTTGVAVRLRNTWLTVPRRLAPVVTLTERFHEQTGLQHVAVVTTMPGIGRVYEYAGSFVYELGPEGEESDWMSRGE
jgi:hypothetical protein